MRWGVEADVIERFGAAGIPAENISFTRETCTFHFPGPPQAFVDTFRRFYGPTMNAFEAAEKNGKAGDLKRELEDLFRRLNRSGREDVTTIDSTFLRVTVSVA
jgi:hypothetical protein